MTWAEQVRTYYAAAFMMLVSSIFSMVISAITRMPVKLDIFIVAFAVNIAIYFLMSRTTNKWTAILAPIILAAVYEFIFYSIPLAIINSIFVLFLNLLFIKENTQIIDYDSYRGVLYKGISGVLVAAVLYSIFNKNYGIYVYRVIIIYLILTFIALRETLGYCNHIKKSKRTRITNVVLAVMALLLTRNFFFNLLKKVSNIILDVIFWILDCVFKVVCIVIGPPLQWIYTKLSGREIIFDIGTVGFNNEGGIKNQIEYSNEGGTIPVELIVTIFKVIAIIALIVVIIMIIRKIGRIDINDKDESFIETTEAIAPEEKTKKQHFKKIRELFRKKGTPKEEVLYRYGKLISTSRKRGIFKKYMTPRQLENRLKLKVDDKETLSRITSIYNEAKFSTHEIESKHENDMNKMVSDTNKAIDK